MACDDGYLSISRDAIMSCVVGYIFKGIPLSRLGTHRKHLAQ